jgi:hypothetical protein
MLILVGVSLALAAGVLSGGKIARLGSARVAWWWVGLAAFVAQIAAVYGPGREDDGLAVLLIVGSHVAIVVTALLNNRLPGAYVLLAGLLMNLACIVANGGLMPVAPETLAMAGRVEAWKVGAGTAGTRVQGSKDVILPTDQTRLALLSDRYWTGLPGRLSVLFSLGDVLLVAGISTFVFATMTTKDLSDAKTREPSPARLAVVPAVWE